MNDVINKRTLRCVAGDAKLNRVADKAEKTHDTEDAEAAHLSGARQTTGHQNHLNVCDNE